MAQKLATIQRWWASQHKQITARHRYTRTYKQVAIGKLVNAISHIVMALCTFQGYLIRKVK